MQGTKFNESPVFFLKKEGRKNIHNEIKSKKKNCKHIGISHFTRNNSPFIKKITQFQNKNDRKKS